MTSRPKILIVEDNSDIRRLYAIGLNQRGYEVKLASDGAQAIERLERERPDVILLDWLMPLMDGGQVLDKIGVPGEQVPIIVISGQPAPDDEHLDPRIRSWLMKPITIDEIVQEISHHGAALQPS